MAVLTTKTKKAGGAHRRRWLARFSWFTISLVTVALLGTATPASADATPAGVMLGPGAMISNWNHMCLDEDPNPGIYDGAPVRLWSCNGSKWQNWLVMDDWTIVNQWSGLCLDADKSVPAFNGTNVQMWHCIPGEDNLNHGNQAWTWPGTGYDNWANPWASLGNGGRGRCLDADISHGSFNGMRVQIWDCNGQSNQGWRQP
jgi:hypothetical protein